MGYLIRQVIKMAVDKIEQYRQKNGTDILKVILKPTSKFQTGYFYAPAEAIDLVKKYAWRLHAEGKNRVYILATNNSNYHPENIHFHIKLFEFYNNYIWQGEIDHRDMVEIDNADENLEPVTSQQNKFNRLTRGYFIATHLQPAIFTAHITVDGKHYSPFKSVRNEADACNIQNYTEQVLLKEELGSQYYMFDFRKYRRDSKDILDLERTGQISEEEATYRHILKYSQNAWYYYRYGLQDYFKQYHIPVPQYRIDDMGFMNHPITGEKLCPF